jgi:hypothetical protein
MTMALSSRPKGSLSLYSVDVTAFAAGAAIQDDIIATALMARTPRERFPSRSESPKIAFRSWANGGSSVLDIASFIETPPGWIL